MRLLASLTYLLILGQALAQEMSDPLSFRTALLQFVHGHGSEDRREELAAQVEDAFASADPKMRTLAAQGAVWLDSGEGRYVAPTEALLTDEDAAVRTAAAKAMATFGPAAEPAADALEALLDDPDAIARREAAIALSGIRPSERCVAVLSEALPEAYVYDVPRIVKALDRMRYIAEPPLDTWMEALSNEIRFNREKPVATALARFGTLAVPRLREALNSEDRNLPVNAAFALGEIGPDAGEAIPELKALLDSDDAWLACTAAIALTKMGHHTDPVLDAMVGFLGKERIVIEPLTLFGDAAVEPVHEAMVTALEGGIVSGESEGAYDRKKIVIGTMNVLELLGPTAGDAAADILPLLHGEDYSLRRHAVFALSEIAPQDADVQSAMRDALSDEDQVVRLRAAATLMSDSAHLEETLPILLDALQEPQDGDRRSVAAGYLKDLPSEHPDAVEALQNALDDVDVRVRLNAAEALWHVAGKTEDVVPVLGAICSASAPFVIEYLDQGVARRMSTESDPVLQTRAVEILGDMGAAATGALPALEAALSDPNPEVRRAAGEAMNAIVSDGVSSTP